MSMLTLSSPSSPPSRGNYNDAKTKVMQPFMFSPCLHLNLNVPWCSCSPLLTSALPPTESTFYTSYSSLKSHLLQEVLPEAPSLLLHPKPLSCALKAPPPSGHSLHWITTPAVCIPHWTRTGRAGLDLRCSPCIPSLRLGLFERLYVQWLNES